MKANNNNRESSSDSDSDSGPTAKSLEKDMMATVSEFSIYVAAITKDLETKEKTAYDDAIARKKKPAKRIWEDSTFKIELTERLLFTLLSPSRLIKYYIVYIHPMKKWLQARQEKFFLKNDHIYPGAPEEDIVFFKNLWAIKGTMTDNEKGVIWQFWDTLIEITEDWQDLTGWLPTKENIKKDDLDVYDIDFKKAEANMAQSSDEE